ncbi:MAG: hypothetical protein P4M08_02045 [Oligoflexia bacterium]|nr:hypothetical protein [Oligoflexia bacterium]
MKPIEKMAVLLALVAATGCATGGNYQRRVTSWQGQRSEQLIQAWGAPDSTERMSSGDQILVYARLKHEPYSSGETPRALASVQGNKPEYIKCATYFDIRDGRIFSVMFQGDECRWKD